MPDDPRPTGYLVDTNVLSNRADRHDPNVSEWLRRYAGLIRISVVTAAEMRRGLLLLERKVDKISDRKVRDRERQRLHHKTVWYDEVTADFANRFIPIDLAVAGKWAEISVKFPSLRDGDKVIAATALAKGYGVATENLGDFREAGVPLMNPFDPDTWIDEYDDDPIRRLF